MRCAVIPVADEVALVTLELPSRAEAPAAARKALTSLDGARRLVGEARLREARIVVTGLVANAVRYGGSDRGVRMGMRATDETRGVAGIDVGPGFDPDRLAGPAVDRAGGWGLGLVAGLAHRWGVRSGSATTVWFVFDRPGRESAVRVENPIVEASDRRRRGTM